MPKICYVPRNFRGSTLAVIEQANKIIEEYQAQGFVLTLRQLYYQFVARDLIENKAEQYEKLGRTVTDARLAGLIDWEAIEDRGRGLESLAHWDSPAAMVEAAAQQFRIDKWASQDCRIEVWIEKAALAGVFEGVCKSLDVPCLACIGYNSWSEMWRAAYHRIGPCSLAGQRTIILHFGDHDPSGLDMTRDIRDRLATLRTKPEVRRLALNLAQVRKHKPPPNFAKESDTRYPAYKKKYGEKCWELDALDPTILQGLVRTEIERLLDGASWNEAVSEEESGRALLTSAAATLDGQVANR